MNLILITLFAVASISLLPTEALGKKDLNYNGLLKKKYELKKRGKVSIGDEREVLIRNVRGTNAKTQSNDGTNANEFGKARKNRKPHKSPVDNSHQSSLLPAHESAVHHAPATKQSEEQSVPRSSSKNKQHNQAKPKRKEQLRTEEHESHQNRSGSDKRANERTLNNSNNNNKNSNDKSDENGSSSCRYTKSAWTECDPKTNKKSRTLTLKKAEDGCEATRTIQKKCKKSCRYERGAWSECTNGRMTRTDSLKANSGDSSSCQPSKEINKNCNTGKPKDKGNKERKNKDKGPRKARA